jgi:hypothetical protein
MPIEDKPAYAISEWCVEARVSPAFYFKEHKNGRGPRTVHMGRRAIVTESPRAFFERLEREAAPALPIREAV